MADHRARTALRELLLSIFTAPQLRSVLNSLPESRHVQLHLPGDIASMAELVERALVVLEGAHAINRVFFQALREHSFEGHQPRIDAVMRLYFPIRPGEQVGAGDYGVVLMHLHFARPFELMMALQRHAGLRPDAAKAIVERVAVELRPQLICSRLPVAAARELGQGLERLGALVSYQEPPGPQRFPRRYRTPKGLVMLDIPAGGYLRNGQQLAITQPYRLLETPVTQALFQEVMETNPSEFRGQSRPVEQVSRQEAMRFCERLSALEGRIGHVYRLPTEAEWEYAALAGTQTRYAGSDRWTDVAWTDIPRTESVRGRQPNAWGLFDLSGNVEEWVSDGFQSVPPHGSDPLVPWTPPQSPGVLKGGSFLTGPDSLRVHARRAGPAGMILRGCGFRIAQTIDPGPKNGRP